MTGHRRRRPGPAVLWRWDQPCAPPRSRGFNQDCGVRGQL